jgi:hypothetical protein
MSEFRSHAEMVAGALQSREGFHIDAYGRRVVLEIGEVEGLQFLVRLLVDDKERWAGYFTDRHDGSGRVSFYARTSETAHETAHEPADAQS